MFWWAMQAYKDTIEHRRKIAMGFLYCVIFQLIFIVFIFIAILVILSAMYKDASFQQAV